MCDRESQFTNSPEPTGPTDESFTYSVTESGQRALAAALLTDADCSARRRAFRRSLRQRGRRVGTVYTRFKDGRFVPEVRLCGAWLEIVGFHLGRTFEIGVEPGTLIVRAVSA